MTSALLPAGNSDSENEPALKPFNRPGSEAAMTSDAAEDDESIESYMQQLLSRVRGDNSPTGTTGPNPIYKAAAAPHAADEKKPAEAAKPLSITPVTKEEYIPRTAAPEQSMSLAAMREVANSQARSAIQTHASKVGKKQSSGRFLAATVSFALAGAGVWWGLEMHSRPAIAGGTIGIIVGSYWLIQGIWLARGHRERSDAGTARGLEIERQRELVAQH